MHQFYRLFLPFLLICFVIISDAQAQKWNVGGAYTYGLKHEHGGANIRGYYQTSEKLSIGGELTYLYPHEQMEGRYHVSNRYIEYAVNLHYKINVVERLTLYPLAGANIATRLRKSTDIRGNTTDRLSKGGLSFGAGVFYEINIYRPFIEFRHNINELGQPQLFIGATIKLFPPEKDTAE